MNPFKDRTALNPKSALYNYTRTELGPLLETLGGPPYAGKQVFGWLYQKRARSISDMTDLSASFRESLASSVALQPLTLGRKQISSDGTFKYAWTIPSDGGAGAGTVESVLIPMQVDEEGEAGRFTACVSTQAGCRMKCAFCATGIPKFGRNLTTAEIVGQVLGMEHDSDVRFHNVVVMGMGEPLDNYDATLKAVRILNDPDGLNLGRRRITVSTSGLLEPLKRFTKDDWPASLAVSLHSAITEKRDRLMPVNRSNPLDKLRKLIRDYTFARKLPVTLEVVLMKGVNDGPDDADALSFFTQGLLCKVNLIRFNAVPGLPFESPGDAAVSAFQKRLKSSEVRVFVRERKGADIAAACGQLSGAQSVNSLQETGA